MLLKMWKTSSLTLSHRANYNISYRSRPSKQIHPHTGIGTIPSHPLSQGRSFIYWFRMLTCQFQPCFICHKMVCFKIWLCHSVDRHTLNGNPVFVLSNIRAKAFFIVMWKPTFTQILSRPRLYMNQNKTCLMPFSF